MVSYKLIYVVVQILEYDIMINCINLNHKISPLVTRKILSLPNRKATVCVDISCDYANPNNPIPIYHQSSNLNNPVIPIITTDPLYDLIAVDNLPSLFPQESSNDFSKQLYPYLTKLSNSLPSETENDIVWQRAEKFFF